VIWMKKERRRIKRCKSLRFRFKFLFSKGMCVSQTQHQLPWDLPQNRGSDSKEWRTQVIELQEMVIVKVDQRKRVWSADHQGHSPFSF
jgi:hypothetical protein